MGARISRPVAKNIDLICDVPGDDPVAKKGCEVTYNARFFLRKGDEVTRDALSIAMLRITPRTVRHGLSMSRIHCKNTHLCHPN